MEGKRAKALPKLSSVPMRSVGKQETSDDRRKPSALFRLARERPGGDGRRSSLGYRAGPVSTRQDDPVYRRQSVGEKKRFPESRRRALPSPSLTSAELKFFSSEKVNLGITAELRATLLRFLKRRKHFELTVDDILTENVDRKEARGDDAKTTQDSAAEANSSRLLDLFADRRYSAMRVVKIVLNKVDVDKCGNLTVEDISAAMLIILLEVFFSLQKPTITWGLVVRGFYDQFHPDKINEYRDSITQLLCGNIQSILKWYVSDTAEQKRTGIALSGVNLLDRSNMNNIATIVCGLMYVVTSKTLEFLERSDKGELWLSEREVQRDSEISKSCCCHCIDHITLCSPKTVPMSKLYSSKFPFQCSFREEFNRHLRCRFVVLRDRDSPAYTGSSLGCGGYFVLVLKFLALPLVTGITVSKACIMWSLGNEVYTQDYDDEQFIEQKQSRSKSRTVWRLCEKQCWGCPCRDWLTQIAILSMLAAVVAFIMMTFMGLFAVNKQDTSAVYRSNLVLVEKCGPFFLLYLFAYYLYCTTPESIQCLSSNMTEDQPKYEFSRKNILDKITFFEVKFNVASRAANLRSSTRSRRLASMGGSGSPTSPASGGISENSGGVRGSRVSSRSSNLDADEAMGVWEAARDLDSDDDEEAQLINEVAWERKRPSAFGFNFVQLVLKSDSVRSGSVRILRFLNPRALDYICNGRCSWLSCCYKCTEQLTVSKVDQIAKRHGFKIARRGREFNSGPKKLFAECRNRFRKGGEFSLKVLAWPVQEEKKKDRGSNALCCCCQASDENDSKDAIVARQKSIIDQAQEGDYSSIPVALKEFFTKTEDSYNKQVKEQCLRNCMFSSWLNYLVIPIILVGTYMFLPSLIRHYLGQKFGGEKDINWYCEDTRCIWDGHVVINQGPIEQTTCYCKGEGLCCHSYPIIKTIYAFHLTYAFLLAYFVITFNLWLKRAFCSLYQLAAFNKMSTPAIMEEYGLNFFIRLDSPVNIQSWILLRRMVFRSIKSRMDSIVPAELLLVPVLLYLILVSITMIFYVLTYPNFVPNVISGSFCIVVLLGYTVGILYYCAEVNDVVNSGAIACLHHAKFKGAENIWANSTAEVDDGEDADAATNPSDKPKKDKRQIADKLAAVEMMLDSTVDRILNDSDEGLKLTIFGFPITKALMIQVAGPLGSAVLTAIGFVISKASEQ